MAVDPNSNFNANFNANSSTNKTAKRYKQKNVKQSIGTFRYDLEHLHSNIDLSNNIGLNNINLKNTYMSISNSNKPISRERQWPKIEKM